MNINATVRKLSEKIPNLSECGISLTLETASLSELQGIAVDIGELNRLPKQHLKEVGFDPKDLETRLLIAVFGRFGITGQEAIVDALLDTKPD